MSKTESAFDKGMKWLDHWFDKILFKVIIPIFKWVAIIFLTLVLLTSMCVKNAFTVNFDEIKSQIASNEVFSTSK